MTLPCFTSLKTSTCSIGYLALHLVAQVPAGQFAGNAKFVKQALLEERWADALVAWINLYDIPVDVFEHRRPRTQNKTSEASCPPCVSR